MAQNPQSVTGQPVTGPDGKPYMFPAGTTKEQAVAYFKKKGIGVPTPPSTPEPEGGTTRFAHAAGFPATPGEVSSMAMNILLPSESPTAPGAFQNIPLVGGMFRAQRETYEEAVKEAKKNPNASTYGNVMLSLLPLIGPPAVAGSKAIESKDWSTAAGSILNIGLQALGMRKPSLSPSEAAIRRTNLPTHEVTNVTEVKDAIDRSMSPDRSLSENLAASQQAIKETPPSVRRTGTQYKSPIPYTTVPYRPGQKVRPGTVVTGAPRGFGKSVAKRFGLSPALAEKVDQRVQEIQNARKQAESARRGVERTSRVTERATQATSQSIGEAAERDIAREREAGQFSQQMVSQVEGQVVQELERQIGAAEESRKSAGTQLVRDVAKASWEEYQRVRQPFQEIGEQVTQPVATGEQIRQVVNNAVKDAGGNVSEIPGSAFKAVTKEQPIGTSGAVDIAPGEPLPQYILDALTPEERAQGSISFNDMTRIREDLYGAASASKDTAIKRGLYQAADQITEMQQRAADSVGLGERYKAAKTEYKNFRRGIGSPMMEKFLAAEDAKQQAIIPKLAKFANKATDEALRTVLRSVGIDTSEYDRIGQFIDYSKGRLKTIPKEAEAERKALAARSKGRVSAIEAAAKEQQKGLGGIDTAAEMKEIAKTEKEIIKQAQKAGKDIVPGYKVEDLEGMSNEQLNRLRLDRMVNKIGGNGYALYQIIWGLTGLAFHSPIFGAFHLIRGVSESVPGMLRSPTFQDYVIKRAGVNPGTVQAFRLRQAFSNLSKAWPSITRAAAQDNQ